MRGDKMASELSLTWDEHQSTLVGVFEKLLEAGALVDCTIAAEGQYLKAHKIILSACSPYFEMLFTEEKEKNPIVVLKDIKFQELRAMIDFIYRGKVKVPEERLGDFVDAAESLQIKGLGVGNRNLNSPELTTTESSAVTRKKEGRVSPVPRKRSRRSHGNNSGDSIRVISPSLEESNTTSSEDVQHQSQMDVPSTSQREVSSPSVVNATDSSSLYPAVECSEEVNVESNEPISFAETSLPATEPIPNPTNVVVKCEPEPMAEVYVPEIECYIEPKSEEVVLQETMLDCGSGDMDQAAGDSQHSSNQYSAFSSALQASTSTSSGRTDNLMLMADAGPSFSTQGADAALLRLSPPPQFATTSPLPPRHASTDPAAPSLPTNKALMLSYRVAQPHAQKTNARQGADDRHPLGGFRRPPTKLLCAVGDSVVLTTHLVNDVSTPAGDSRIRPYRTEPDSSTHRPTGDPFVTLRDPAPTEATASPRRLEKRSLRGRSDSTPHVAEPRAPRREAAGGRGLVRHDSSPSLDEITTIFRAVNDSVVLTPHDSEASCSLHFSSGQFTSRRLLGAQCAKKLAAPSELTRNAHERSGERYCKCQQCGKVVTRELIVETRQRLQYDEKNLQQCDECGAIFSHRASVQRCIFNSRPRPSL